MNLPHRTVTWNSMHYQSYGIVVIWSFGYDAELPFSHRIHSFLVPSSFILHALYGSVCTICYQPGTGQLDMRGIHTVMWHIDTAGEIYWEENSWKTVARFMGPTWGPSCWPHELCSLGMCHAIFVRGNHRSRWIPHRKASDAELWCFLWSASE